MFGSNERYREAAPFLYMMTTVLCYSAAPVFFSMGEAVASPFLFTGIYSACLPVVVGTAMPVMFRKTLMRPEVLRDISAECKSGLMMFSIAVHCGFVLFALGLAFVDIAVMSVLYQTWPLFWMLAMSFMFRGTDRYRKITPGTFGFAFMAMAGVWLVVSSGDASLGASALFGALSAGGLAGLFLAIMTSVCAGARSVTLKMGDRLASAHTPPAEKKRLAVIFTMVMTVICQGVASVVFVAIGIGTGETISGRQVFLAIACGVTTNTIGMITLRLANLNTRNLGVNAMAYTTPLVTLAWLWLFSMLGVQRVDHLVLGAVGIATANTVITAGASIKAGYRILAAFVWTVGTVVYLYGTGGFGG